MLGCADDVAGAALFQGVLARGASRGTILVDFADSDDEPGRLNDNPKVTYATTVKAQVARAYDRAFGQDAEGLPQDWGCGGQSAIFAFVLWLRVDAWLGC